MSAQAPTKAAPARRRPAEAQAGGVSIRTVLNVVTVALGLPFGLSMVLAMFHLQDYDPLFLAFDRAGAAKMLYWTGLLVGLAIFAADEWLDRYNGSYADELYSIMKDVAESVKSGMSVEAAVQKACGWKTSPPAVALKEALTMSRDIPFEAALRAVAARSGQPAFKEVALLTATAVEGGGNIGPALRWLAAHLTRMRLSEKEFSGTIESALMVLRGVGLLAGPFLYKMLYFSFHRFEKGIELDVPTVAFFTYGTVMMAMLDGIVYGRWARVPAKLPFYLGLIRLSLGIW